MASPAIREVVAAAVLAAAFTALGVMALESRNIATIVHDMSGLVRQGGQSARPDCLIDHAGDRCAPAIDIDHPSSNEPHTI